AVVESGELQEMGASDVRGGTWKIQDTDSRHCRRTGLPGAVHAIAGIFQRVAAARSAVEAGGFSGRGALGAEAAEFTILVQDVFGLAGGVREITDRCCSRRAQQCCAPTE